jgi:hypothetical protein
MLHTIEWQIVTGKTSGRRRSRFLKRKCTVILTNVLQNMEKQFRIASNISGFKPRSFQKEVQRITVLWDTRFTGDVVRFFKRLCTLFITAVLAVWILLHGRWSLTSSVTCHNHNKKHLHFNVPCPTVYFTQPYLNLFIYLHILHTTGRRPHFGR